jgi:hypothetical protein
LNNTGGPVKDKLEFLELSKFNIAFENSRHPGYVTEKIVEAFIANTVPIYWGAPDVDLEFNPKSFIDISNFKSMDEAISYIKEVDQDDDLYLKYLAENPMSGGTMPEYSKDVFLKSFLERCIDKIHSTKPVSKSNRFRIYKLKVLLKRLEYRLNRYTGHMKGFR